MNKLSTMNIIFFDDHKRKNFYPLDLGRPLAHLLTGCYTSEERWSIFSSSIQSIQYLTEDYLQATPIYQEDKEYLYINARLIASRVLKEQMGSTPKNKSVVQGDNLLWIKTNQTFHDFESLDSYARQAPSQSYDASCIILENVWDLYLKNEAIIAQDITTLPKEYQVSESLAGVYMDHPERIYIHPDAQVKPCFLSAEKGYIYIGPHATIQTGAMVQGSLIMLESSELKMGAKVYGSTTLGNHVKIGGEISNVIFFPYSNKGHEGFIGNSVIGSWCNFGADTNSSNLKNNYSKIKIWNPYLQKNIDTQQQFLGILMGDHCKLGINTMLNTGTVVGIHSNIFGADFPPKFIPSFSWGGAEKIESYHFPKALETAERMMARRGKTLKKKDISIFEHISKQNKL